MCGSAVSEQQSPHADVEHQLHISKWEEPLQDKLSAWQGHEHDVEPALGYIFIHPGLR